MLNQRLAESCARIETERVISPLVAIVLGSGLGGLVDEVEDSISIPYQNIPHFPTLSAEGHAGNLVLGHLADKPVVVMQGRPHLYEGLSLELLTYPIRVMRKLGASILLASNASGGINPRYQSGDLVLIDEHIDLMKTRARIGSRTDECWDPTDIPDRQGGTIYDLNLIELAQQIGTQMGLALNRGTYCATLGPNYETRAEYRYFRKIGADMVGMSTLPETMLASNLGMRVIAVSVITNVAVPDMIRTTHHAEVLDWGNQAQKKLVPLTRALVKSLSTELMPGT